MPVQPHKPNQHAVLDTKGISGLVLRLEQAKRTIPLLTLWDNADVVALYLGN